MTGRLLNTILCAVATFGVVSQFVLTGTGPADAAEIDPGVVTSVIRFFTFFTILSNLMVVVSSLPIALGARLNVPLRVLRLNAVAAIVITGVVHWFLLRPGSDLHGLTALVDVVTHIIVPILMVVVWLVAGPRGLTDRLVVVGSFAFPVLYAGWIFLYGALTDWYPYHFIDVAMIGYGPALTMAAVIFVAFAALSLLAWRVDVALLRAKRVGRGERGRREMASHAQR